MAKQVQMVMQKNNDVLEIKYSFTQRSNVVGPEKHKF